MLLIEFYLHERFHFARVAINAESFGTNWTFSSQKIAQKVGKLRQSSRNLCLKLRARCTVVACNLVGFCLRKNA